MYPIPESTRIPSTPTSRVCLINKRKRLNSSNRRDNENNFNVVNNNSRNKQKFVNIKRLSTSEMEKKKIKQNESREIRKAMLTKRKMGNGQQVARGRPPLSNKTKLSCLGENNFNKDRINSATKFVLGSKGKFFF